MATGLRRGELLGLRWIDVRSDAIWVRQQLTFLAGEFRFKPTKTRQGTRLVAISPDASEVLVRHRERQEADRSLLGSAWAESGLVFTSEVGTPIHPQNFYGTWAKLKRRAGVPHMRLHDLRHLHVSLLVKRGLDPRTIADRVGHTSPAFTLKRYSHLFEEQRRAAAVSLEDLLGTKAGEDPD